MRRFELKRKKCCDYVASFDDIDSYITSVKSDFDSIVAYHGTKLNDRELKDLKTQGIRRGSKSLLYRKAIERFISPDDKRELKKAIKIEIDRFFKAINGKHRTEIHFGIDKYELIEKWNHYLFFGTETLLPLADKLKQKFDISFRQRMITSGKPYLITADIPLNLVDEEHISGIFDYLVNGASEASLVYYRQIPATWILKISEVKRLVNTQNFSLC